MDRVKIIVTPHEISWETNSNAIYAEIDTMLRDATHEWEYERERHSKYEYNLGKLESTLYVRDQTMGAYGWFRRLFDRHVRASLRHYDELVIQGIKDVGRSLYLRYKFPEVNDFTETYILEHLQRQTYPAYSGTLSFDYFHITSSKTLDDGTKEYIFEKVGSYY